jgi:murein DD-endopeptidase MepM/ murein hydrolase activator NlpD
MHLRQWRPVAALTLALLAAPFLAATAVAAAADTSSAASPPSAATKAAPAKTVVSVDWLSTTKASLQRLLDTIEYTTKAAEIVIPPSPIDPAPPVRAVSPPPPPPPPSIEDKSTWAYPANGPITSGYGRRWGRMHEGVDIDAPYGGAVVAGHRGTVVAAGWGQSGYGRVVHIDHGNGIVTTYNHLSAVNVSVGQFVERGVKVGAVGASGSVTAAHLHYEVRIGGAAVNPGPWLTGPHSAAGNPG